MVKRVSIWAALGPPSYCAGNSCELVPCLHGYEHCAKEPLYRGRAQHLQYSAHHFLLYGAWYQWSEQVEGADVIERRRIHNERYHNFPPISIQAWFYRSQQTMVREDRYERLDIVLEKSEQLAMGHCSHGHRVQWLRNVSPSQIEH